jgi:glyoxalase/bleomycin resistance protein/dioxygenase superfamily protein
MATVQVRYVVHDVDAAIAFYCQHLGFHEVMHPAPAFAMLSRGDLRLALSAPNPVGGGGQSMPDGTKPTPGGWNRFSIEVTLCWDKAPQLLGRVLSRRWESEPDPPCPGGYASPRMGNDTFQAVA